MKCKITKLILLISIWGIIACNGKVTDDHILKKEISASSITSDIGCENCGMNLKKFISTSHAVRMNNGDSHFYCSINCSSVAFEELKENAKSVFAIDYGLTKYFPIEEMHYVIGSSLPGTMTKISKFAFINKEKAENFKSTFSGKEIVSYTEALNMSFEEINSRKKTH